MSGPAASVRNALRRSVASRRAAASAALLAIAAAVANGAEDRPNEVPTRDVAVIYRMVGGAAPEQTELRMSWLAAEGLVRTELPGGMWTVANPRDAAAGFMVMESMRMVMPVPAGAEAPPGGAAAPADNNGAAAAVRYARAGTAAYAGQTCTVWRYGSANQKDGEVCVTADGLVLRAVSTHKGQAGGMEATQVVYGPQDPARFRKPAGYQEMQPPAASPNAGAPKQ